jgi:DNA polymerase-3 subunit epsilon
VIFAICDIETTGSYASGNSITEIAVCLHNGKVVIDRWQSLIKPAKSIPRFITELTGITNEMVEDAPTFAEIAEDLDAFTKDTVFVAHNVNFDYSFIKKHFEHIGITWNRKKLCTIRLSKQIHPEFKRYSLSRLCISMNVINQSPHRAMGDTMATAEIFGKLFAKSPELIQEALKRGSGEAFLPNQLKAEVFHSLPEDAGVYYFLDVKGKPVYIGKAKNIKKRIRSHFSGNMKSDQKQGFIKEVADIQFRLTGTELIALIVEDHEIKMKWPKFNRAQKFQSGRYGVYDYEDQLGFKRLCIKKVSNSVPPIRTFSSAFSARQWLYSFAEENKLEFRLCGLPQVGVTEVDQDEHNQRISDAVSKEQGFDLSVLIKGKGRNEDEESFVMLNNGRLKGIGYIPNGVQINRPDELDDFLETFPASELTDSLIRSFLPGIAV